MIERYKVYKVPSLKLKQKALPVNKIDDDIQLILDRMLKTMRADDGMGLAATQVGIMKRIMIIDPSDRHEEPAPLFFINPKIVWQSEEEVELAEACISVPGVHGELIRSAEVELEYTDRYNNPQSIREGGYFGRCILHEMDHLNGMTFLDHLSPIKRRMLLNRSVRHQKAELKRQQEDKE